MKYISRKNEYQLVEYGQNKELPLHPAEMTLQAPPHGKP